VLEVQFELHWSYSGQLMLTAFGALHHLGLEKLVDVER
jgi:hypothetical protein